MTGFGFCDRCGAFAEFAAWQNPACSACELGMNSIAAVLNPSWSRPMTAAEVQLAAVWLAIGCPEPIDTYGRGHTAAVNADGGSPCRATRRNDN